ncbi:MAG: DUF6434 domain-containing protein, partial [Pseudomonadota bacterium]
FEASTLIGENWRCTQALREFFTVEFGKSFRFNQALRTFIATQVGHTLEDAMACYRESLIDNKKPIAKQFEYNIHMRQFYRDNPGASHTDAVVAWWEKRANRGG